MFVTMSRFKSRPTREVIAIMTPPSPRTLDTSSDKARTLSHVANQDLLHEGYFKQSELRSDFATAVSAGCDLFDTTVHISPSDLVKRHCTQRYGIVTESIYAPTRSRIEIRYDAPVHLLVLYEDGVRREGETSIDELPPSTLRNFANKLTFVPAGHFYREWHDTSTAIRMTYLYLSPTKLHKFIDADTAYAPRAFFEDPILWATATKLKHVIESNQCESMLYFDALASVLAHELSRSGRELNSDLTNKSRWPCQLAKTCCHRLYRRTPGRASISHHACSARSAKPASFLSSLQAILRNSTAGISSSAAD